MTDTFDIAKLTAELTLDEGVRQYPYTDTRGFLSIGRGRNLTGKGLAPDEVEYLFDNDIRDCCTCLDKHVPWWRDLPPHAQRTMLNLSFMGWNHLATFTHFLAAMQAHNWIEAAAELQDSRWYRQVGERGPRVVARLLGGPAPTAVA